MILFSSHQEVRLTFCSVPHPLLLPSSQAVAALSSSVLFSSCSSILSGPGMDVLQAMAAYKSAGGHKQSVRKTIQPHRERREVTHIHAHTHALTDIGHRILVDGRRLQLWCCHDSRFTALGFVAEPGMTCCHSIRSGTSASLKPKSRDFRNLTSCCG